MSFRRVVALTALIALGSAQAQTDAPAAPQAQPAEPAATPAPSEMSAQDSEIAQATGTPAAGTPATTAPLEKKATPTEPIVYGDAEAGAGKAGVCAACHGADGNSADKQYPKIAGQNEAYIARQLSLFKSGTRANPIMMGFASTLSPQDMHDIGAYFSTKTSLPGVADDQFVARATSLYRGGDAKLGVPACMACHGPDGRGMAGAGYPQLAGQWSGYVATTLKAWKDGTTWGTDAHAAIMPTIVSQLSEADIAALASYVEGLHTAGASDNTAAR